MPENIYFIISIFLLQIKDASIAIIKGTVQRKYKILE